MICYFVIVEVYAVVIKGYSKFREKLPALSGKKIVILPIYFICVSIIAFVVYVIFDSLPAAFTKLGINEIFLSFFPLFGVIIVEFAGLLLVWQMWFWRDHLKAKYGSKAYQRIFFVGISGVMCLFTVAINQYIPFYLFAPDFWASSPLQVIATPLETYLGVVAPMIFCIKSVFTVIFLVFGILMAARAIQVFGLDYMAVVYLYFPEESQIQENKIYSALRHPTYAGLLFICLGGAFYTFTILSFSAYLIFLAGFYVHVHFVEEKELIERFGESYCSYQKKVPAFFVSPNNIRVLVRFLFKRTSK